MTWPANDWRSSLMFTLLPVPSRDWRYREALVTTQFIRATFSTTLVTTPNRQGQDKRDRHGHICVLCLRRGLPSQAASCCWRGGVGPAPSRVGGLDFRPVPCRV